MSPLKEKIIVVSLLILLPFLAVGLVTYVVVIFSTPDLLPLWAAILVGVIIGTLWLVMHILASGTDMMDTIVSSIVTIILALMILPVGVKAKEERLRKKQNIFPAQMQKQHPQQN